MKHFHLLRYGDLRVRPHEELRKMLDFMQIAILTAQIDNGIDTMPSHLGKVIMRKWRMTGRQVRELCPLEKPAEQLLRQAVEELGLSIRAHDRVLRVARTIADLDASDNIRGYHLQEAVNYRILDRQLWN